MKRAALSGAPQSAHRRKGSHATTPERARLPCGRAGARRVRVPLRRGNGAPAARHGIMVRMTAAVTPPGPERVTVAAYENLPGCPHPRAAVRA
ncbi:hypothetical protein SUDANB126_01989 [Streptomyces sp. enrichment culture]